MILGVIIYIPFLINTLYSGPDKPITVWNGADLLAFYGAILSSVGTIILGIVSIWQNAKLNKQNEKLGQENKLAQERLERITQHTNDVNIITKLIEFESTRLAELDDVYNRILSVCKRAKAVVIDSRNFDFIIYDVYPEEDMDEPSAMSVLLDYSQNICESDDPQEIMITASALLTKIKTYQNNVKNYINNEFLPLALEFISLTARDFNIADDGNGHDEYKIKDIIGVLIECMDELWKNSSKKDTDEIMDSYNLLQRAINLLEHQMPVYLGVSKKNLVKIMFEDVSLSEAREIFGYSKKTNDEQTIYNL